MSRGGPGGPPPSQPGRRTVAVLMDSMDLFSEGQESELRRGFDVACRKHDLNLLIAFGLPLDSPHPWGAAHNAVYRLMAADGVDGLIVLSSSLATYCDYRSIRRLCDEYGARPLCSVGLVVPGVPSIVVDHCSGMAALVAHLVDEHECRRLSFVGGPADTPDDKIHFEFFRDALQRYGLSCDAEFVANADFVRHSGQDAMDRILDRGVKPDAVVVANDGMALGVIAALRRRGLRVPHDVRVTGVGNLSIGRVVNPPLTTVGHPYQSMAEQAIELLVDQFEGRSVPDCTQVPAQMIIRQTCGCHHPARQRAGLDASGRAASVLRAQADHVRHTLADCLGECEGDAVHDARILVEALQAELEGQTESFLTAFEALLSKIGDQHERYQAFQAAVTALRLELREVASFELEDLWHEARSLITLVTARHHAAQRSRIDDACRRWGDTQDLLSSAIDRPALSDALAQGSRTSGVQSAFVSQYTQDGESTLEPLFCMVDGRPQQPAESRYPTGQLFPYGGYPTDRRHTSLVFPLAFEAQPLGVAVFEYVPEVRGYEVLGRQISAALRSVALHEEVVRRTTLHERSMQERLAAAERVKSLSVLAGGVAHDLNNVLGPLVALPDVVKHELVALEAGEPYAVADLCADLEEMKRGALRASQTVADLLTLGRQGRMTKEPLDLNQMIGASLATASGACAPAAARNISVTNDLHPEPLIVRASEAHIVRALANLVRNAIEAIDRDGRIVIQTRRVVITEPIERYETIEPGDYAVVAVADTGHGIPAPELGRVFEPFFTKKRLTDCNGSGLGLAIIHSVTKEHDGFVDVESEVGVGSTFTLYFPRVVRALERPSLTSHAPRQCLRVLVVDDEPPQLRTARRVLSRYGYEVDTAATGKQAYGFFSRAANPEDAPTAGAEPGKSPYDVVVMDVMLNEPEDGFALFERIRQLFPQQNGVIVSGYASPERAQLVTELGLVWLAKPYTADSLARAVHAALLTTNAPSHRTPAG